MKQDYYLVDSHLHSHYSKDAHFSPRKMVLAAKEKGALYIAFTEHVSLNPQDMCYPPDICFAEYCGELEKLESDFSGGLKIACGLEFGEPHLYFPKFKEALESGKFDFILGSAHWVENIDVGLPFDRSKVDPVDFYRKYFAELLEMVRFGGFDAIAHFDVIKRHDENSYNPEDFKELIYEILKTAVEKNIAIEVNSSGLRFACRELIPSKKILKWYREVGGQLVTVGSDAHYPEHVGFGVEEALKTVRELGFPGVTVYEERKPHLIPWDRLEKK